MILADSLRRGYKVALPMGEDWRYDLIILRKGNLERVQCKFEKSKGAYIEVRCRAANGRGVHKYTAEEIDWIAVYDQTTDKCYYVPSSMIGSGRSAIWLRVTPPKNNQVKGVLWAKDFLEW